MAKPSHRSLELSTVIGLNGPGIERRLKCVGFSAADRSRVLAIQALIVPQAQRLAATFFEFLGGQEEAKALMADAVRLQSARRMKESHLVAMVGGDYGVAYAEERVKLARLYSEAGLETRAFLGAFHHLMREIGLTVMKHFEGKPAEGFDHFMSLKKIAFFDLSLMVDVLDFERQRVIGLQQESIRELSTPVLQIRDGLLLLPLIGVIDTERARQVTEGLLGSIRENRARMVVMDVTGVAGIDSKVANHLLQTIAAARLMGAATIVTGLSSSVAQSLVTLGIDLEQIHSVSHLQGGLEEANRSMGFRVVRDLTASNAA
jgi:rsbT co-antagonist protein RsbR